MARIWKTRGLFQHPGCRRSTHIYLLKVQRESEIQASLDFADCCFKLIFTRCPFASEPHQRALLKRSLKVKLLLILKNKTNDKFGTNGFSFSKLGDRQKDSSGWGNGDEELGTGSLDWSQHRRWVVNKDWAWGPQVFSSVLLITSCDIWRKLYHFSKNASPWDKLRNTVSIVAIKPSMALAVSIPPSPSLQQQMSYHFALLSFPY